MLSILLGVTFYENRNYVKTVYDVLRTWEREKRVRNCFAIYIDIFVEKKKD